MHLSSWINYNLPVFSIGVIENSALVYMGAPPIVTLQHTILSIWSYINSVQITFAVRNLVERKKSSVREQLIINVKETSCVCLQTFSGTAKNPSSTVKKIFNTKFLDFLISLFVSLVGWFGFFYCTVSIEKTIQRLLQFIQGSILLDASISFRLME